MAIELLAPAGSVEALRAAFIAGADAVYIGGNRYGARAYADNPDDEELLEAIRLAHRLGKKLYLTVNTLVKDEELPDVCTWLRPFYEQGLDAVIVQDLGVVQTFRVYFPDLPVHASTQLSVTGADGVRLLQELGIRRVVPARELSLDELKAMREETGIELETFIHGALCYSYSGRCLMSSLIGGRSGNRGRCAGICRLPYQTPEQAHDQESYPLNMKDLCTLHLLPQLLDAGITSFKIEGRMKKPEYTAGVVSVYRRALDAIRDGRWETYDKKEDMALLTALYNRDGFTDGYYPRHNGAGMIALKNEKLQGKRAAAAQNAIGEVRRDLEGKEAACALQMPVNGRLFLHEGQPAACTLTAQTGTAGHNPGEPITVRVKADMIEAARTNASSEEQIRAQFMKTGGSHFRFAGLQTDIGDGIFVPVRTVKELRREAFRQLDKAIEEQYVRTVPAEDVLPSQDGPQKTEQQNSCCETADGPKIFASVLCEEQAEALLEAEDSGSLAAICLPPALSHLAEPLRDRGVEAWLAMPYVFRRERPDSLREMEEQLTGGRWDGVLVRDLEEAGLIRRLARGGKRVPAQMILDAVLYTMNDAASEVFRKWGFAVRTLPYELNFWEMRRQDTAGSQLAVYGRTPMMISSQCVRKTEGNCIRQSGWTSLRDRTDREFPVYCSCESCFNVIYNSLPTGLLQEKEAVRHLHCGSLRMDFTDEDKEQTARIAGAVFRTFRDRDNTDIALTDMPMTRGHFRRGVE